MLFSTSRVERGLRGGRPVFCVFSRRSLRPAFLFSRQPRGGVRYAFRFQVPCTMLRLVAMGRRGRFATNESNRDCSKDSRRWSTNSALRFSTSSVCSIAFRENDSVEFRTTRSIVPDRQSVVERPGGGPSGGTTPIKRTERLMTEESGRRCRITRSSFCHQCFCQNSSDIGDGLR